MGGQIYDDEGRLDFGLIMQYMDYVVYNYTL